MTAACFTIEERYDWDADRHFRAIICFDELAEAMDGTAHYDGLPEGEAVQGQVVDVKIKLFGWLPVGQWRMEVVERDDASLRLKSFECGGAVKAWHHTISVEALSGGDCLHRDTLEIDAGWLTGFYASIAKRMYRKRHVTRKALRASDAA